MSKVTLWPPLEGVMLRANGRVLPEYTMFELRNLSPEQARARKQQGIGRKLDLRQHDFTKPVEVEGDDAPLLIQQGFSKEKPDLRPVHEATRGRIY